MDRNSHLRSLEPHLSTRVYETVETDPKTWRSEWEFLELEMVQIAYSLVEKGKNIYPRFPGTQSKFPFHCFALKLKKIERNLFTFDNIKTT